MYLFIIYRVSWLLLITAAFGYCCWACYELIEGFALRKLVTKMTLEKADKLTVSKQRSQASLQKYLESPIDTQLKFLLRKTTTKLAYNRLSNFVLRCFISKQAGFYLNTKQFKVHILGIFFVVHRLLNNVQICIPSLLYNL